MKTKYIYIKENVIPNDVSKDIITYFENEMTNEKCTSNKNSLFYDIHLTEQWDPIKKHIIDELNKHIESYVFNINEHELLGREPIDDENVQISVLKYRYNNTLTIEKSKDPIEYVPTIINNYSTPSKKLLKFIFILSDYDGEILFWEDHKILLKQGMLLIFPASWCFPFKETSKMKDNRYIIHGFFDEYVIIDGPDSAWPV
jgi:hypothetical protein